MDPCPICRGERWVCSEHPLTPYSECTHPGEPAVPCRCNPLEEMPPLKQTFCQVDGDA